MGSQWWHDIRYSARQLIKTPLTTVVAVVSLALGIGANTAIFSLINTLMLRSLPVHDPQQLVDIHTVMPGKPATEYYADLIPFRAFEQIRERNSVFSGVFAFDDQSLRNIQTGGLQYPGSVIEVSGDYFSTLGVAPLLGRVLTPQDTQPDLPSRVAVLDYRCWRNHFQGDPAIVGKVIRVDNVPLTVVGVTPEGFRNLDADIAVDATVPIGFRRANVRKSWYRVVGRLKPRGTVEQARAELLTFWPSILQAIVPAEYTAAQRKRFLSRGLYVGSARNGYSYLREQFSRPALVLMCLVAVVLLIACANLAGLMLARAAARRREIGIRMALGAGRWPLTRLFVTESVMLSFTGAALGFACSFSVVRFLLNMVWSGIVPVTVDTAPELRVLGFTGAVAVLTAILFGTLPAVRATHVDPASAIQQNSRTMLAGGMMFRRALIAGQVALSLVLVFGALLFIRTLDNLHTVHAGYESKALLCMGLFPQPGHEKIPDRVAYYRELIEKLEGIPGVASASYSSVLPAEAPKGVEFQESVSILPSESTIVQASTGMVGPGFFQAMGMRVLSGREFTWHDDENAPKVAVISDSLARRLFPHEEPVGQRIKIANYPGGNDLQIVGIVSNASLWRLQAHDPPAVYTGFLQNAAQNEPTLDIRTVGEPMLFARPAEQMVVSMHHHYSVRTQSVRERMDTFLSNERVLATCSAFFGALALILAAIGLYALIGEAVNRRFGEIGIRMALGAQRRAILGLFIREAAMLLCVGVAIGIPAALATGRLVSAMLFAVSPAGFASIATPSAILVLTGLLASYVPARGASKVEPMVALRTE